MGKAGVKPGAKQSFDTTNNSYRIPDMIKGKKLFEVKNVKYISNTKQLRDYAKYAKDFVLTLHLYVRPTTIVASTVIEAGWEINYLW